MKLFTTIILFVMILAVTLHFGCNNTTGVEPQKFPIIRFSKTYPATEALDVQPTSDGGFISLGSISIAINNRDLLLFKTDKDGILEWSKAFGDQQNDYPQSLLCTNDGGFLLLSVAEITPGNLGEVSIIKTDNRGNEIWYKFYEESIYDATIQVAHDGGFVITTSRQWTWSSKRGEQIIFKISETGDVIWRKVIYQSNDGIALNGKPFIARCNDNGYLIISPLYSTPNADSTLITKTDLSGNTIWQKKYASKIYPSSLSVLQDGSFICTGTIPVNNDQIAVLMKLNSSGEIEWTKSYQGTSYQSGYWDSFSSAVETIDGNIIVVGHTNRTVNSTGADAWIMEVDKNGNEIWSFIPPGNRGDALYSVKHVQDNMYIAAGSTANSKNPNENAWLLNFDLTPCEQWVKKK